jgi:LAO/AO transport system kinase
VRSHGHVALLHGVGYTQPSLAFMNSLELTERMLAGDRIALARLMTLVENRHPDTVAIMSRIQDRCGHGYTIGITGPPGAGKSTLVDRFVGRLRQDGLSVGILAVDPSSPFSGGALLGDRIRMQSHYLDDQVFIRSLSSRGSHGGLAHATRNVAQLLEAFGKQFIVIETVGVGQTEFDVVRIADTTVVVLVPEAGDTVQTMKAGLLEIADIFVVNKADREGAMRIKTELELMLQMRPDAERAVPVLLTQATTGAGVDALLDAVLQHRNYLHSGEAAAHKAQLRRSEFVAVLREELGRRLDTELDAEPLRTLAERVAQADLDPYAAALEALADEGFMRRLLRRRP